jgi:hypothetical protein
VRISSADCAWTRDPAGEVNAVREVKSIIVKTRVLKEGLFDRFIGIHPAIEIVFGY